MKKTLLLFVSAAVILCFSGTAKLQAQGDDAPRYYVGEVVGLDSVNNAMTITEYNTDTQKKFIFSPMGLPGDVYLGDEVVVSAGKNNIAKDVRLLEQDKNVSVGGVNQSPVITTRRRFGGPNARRWDPFYDIARLQEQMSRMFQDSMRTGGIDQGQFNSNTSFDRDFKLEDKGDEYVLKLDLTGLDKDNVKIEMDKNSITLKGQSETQKQEDGRNGSFRYHSFGTFLKTIPLPPDADSRNTETNLEGNMMTITMPKKTK